MQISFIEQKEIFFFEDFNCLDYDYSRRLTVLL